MYRARDSRWWLATTRASYSTSACSMAWRSPAPSIRMRSLEMSRTSSMSSSTTENPSCGAATTRSCSVSRVSASRTTDRLTLYSVAMARGLSLAPGAYRPARMSARMPAYTARLRLRCVARSGIKSPRTHQDRIAAALDRPRRHQAVAGLADHPPSRTISALTNEYPYLNRFLLEESLTALLTDTHTQHSKSAPESIADPVGDLTRS